MEKKKSIWNSNPLRALFGTRNISSNFFWRVSNTKLSSGFTLIEILITIAVIGILAVGIINIIDPITQLQKAHDAQRKSDLSQIQKALEVYHQDNGNYPPEFMESFGGGFHTYQIISLENGEAIDWGTPWPPYMSILPKDPDYPSKRYTYYATKDQQTYYIYASLDRAANDPQACNPPGSAQPGSPCPKTVSLGEGIQQWCGRTSPKVGGGCNYGVSTPNVSP